MLCAQASDDSNAMGEENFVGGRPQQENVFTGVCARILCCAWSAVFVCTSSTFCLLHIVSQSKTSSRATSRALGRRPP